MHGIKCLQEEMVLANLKTHQDLQEDYKRCQNKMGTKKLPGLLKVASYS